VLTYLLGRAGQALLVLCLVVVLAFSAVQMMPGDALLAALESTGNVADTRGLEEVRKAFGAHGSGVEQFWRWLGKFLRGDWGVSMGTGQDVLEMFRQRAPITLELFLGGLLWALLMGIPVGMLCAFKRGSRLDTFLSGVSLTGIALPPTFEALALIYLLSVLFRILPVSGYTPFGVDPWDNVLSMLMPSFVVGSHLAGVLARYVRASLLEVLRQDFIRTARSKGLTEVQILFRHAIKPSLIPIVTVLGFTFAGMLAGSFIVEVIFALPGIGRMAVDATFAKDFPVVQAVLVVASVNVLLVNFVVDIAYAALDPRIRLR
jgi:peptide/nickel transport system permease protein